VNLLTSVMAFHDPTKRVPPTHDWLHAMDRSSYEWTGPKGSDESCLDPACRRYYQTSCEKEHRLPIVHNSRG
jgi:hypothetical protein